VIRSFADATTEKLFIGEELSRKEANKLGSLNAVKAFERLAILNEADEKSLLRIPALHYHKLKGTSKYSIDADSRKSPWRITFQWENQEMKDVELVRIEDTHRSPSEMKTKQTAIPRDPLKIPKPLSNPAAALIRDTIAHHGITQMEAAEAMKISKAQLSDVIRQKKGVSANIALRVQFCFDIPGDLLTRLQAQYDFQKAYHSKDQDFRSEVRAIA
jgi:addiction module HigA family antidote